MSDWCSLAACGSIERLPFLMMIMVMMMFASSYSGKAVTSVLLICFDEQFHVQFITTR